jgi:2-methylisocitrate lyase-like PEP mutase family enzyme
MADKDLISFIGVYDVFSASIAAQYYNGIFISGFSFAASFYGLPDIGFIAWPDIVAFVQRVRTVLPRHHLLVDIDDGYADTEVACHVVSLLEASGASAVIIEDQQRPRRCGHFDGKQIMELEDFVVKLQKVLATRCEMLVVARTDAADPAEIVRRVKAFAEAGADAILVDAIQDLELIRSLKSQVSRPLMFNQIAGGKSPSWSLRELSDAGVSLVNHSTPCLFAAQAAIDGAMKFLQQNNGSLKIPGKGDVDVGACTVVLKENLARRDKKISAAILSNAVGNPALHIKSVR